MAQEELEKDYYKVLGVSAEADQATIKSAYRKCRVKAHPDTAGGSAEKFRQVEEAWGVLGDESKRNAYDLLRSSAPNVQAPAEAPKASNQSNKRHENKGEMKQHQGNPQPAVRSPQPTLNKYSPTDNRSDLKSFSFVPVEGKTFYPKLVSLALGFVFIAFLGGVLNKDFFSSYAIAGVLGLATLLVRDKTTNKYSIKLKHLTSLLGIVIACLPILIHRDNPSISSLIVGGLYAGTVFASNLVGDKWSESVAVDKLVPPTVVKEGRVFGKIPHDIQPAEAALLREIQERLSLVTFNVDGVFLVSVKFEGQGMFWLVSGNRVVVVAPLIVPKPGKYGFSPMGYITTAEGEHFPHQVELLMELMDKHLSSLSNVNIQYLFPLFPQGGGVTLGATHENITLCPVDSLSQAADVLVSSQDNVVRRDVLKSALSIMPS